MAARTAALVGIVALLLGGCGDPNASPATAPIPTLTPKTTEGTATATEPPATPAELESTTSAAAPPVTAEATTTTSEAPATTTTTPPSSSVAPDLETTFEVEGVTVTVAPPDGAVPDPRGEPTAPPWAPVSEGWFLPECHCSVRFVVQTFVPPRYGPDLVETFVSGPLTWNVYDTSHAGSYYQAAADTDDGLAIQVGGTGAPLEMIKEVARSVTASGVREAPLWDGTADVDVASGMVTAPGFNEFVDTRQPVAARTAADAASMLVGPDQDPETLTELSEMPGGAGLTIVTVTKSHLLDDSVEAVRYEFELQQMADTLFRFVSGRWSQRCQPDRGHQDFTIELCV